MKKVPLLYYIVAGMIGCISIIFLHNISAKSSNINPVNQLNDIPLTQEGCGYKLSRLHGYKYIQPLLFITQECESEKYNSLKSQIINYLNTCSNADPASKVSVYLCDLTKEGSWMGINTEEAFCPGSLLKVVLLITHLKAAERDPSILDKKVKFNLTKNITPPTQHFNSKTIIPGHTYTVKELLKYMIAYSDNYATWLLNNYVDKESLKATFTDFGFAKPDLMDPRYTINTRDYSYFMRALYNAGYLHISSSEFALSLLTESDFNEGIVKGIPSSVVVAHKFGETGSSTEHQLHESAIVFLNNNPYLLTIMTKGRTIETQPEILRNISNMTYNFMSSQKPI